MAALVALILSFATFDVGEAANLEGEADDDTPAVARIESEVALSKDSLPVMVGEIRADGLVFRIMPDGASVALVGWYGKALPGNVAIPASVSTGASNFEVVAVEDEAILKGSEVESLTIPASVEKVVDGALSGCDSLARIIVSEENESYSSFDGMLFSKDLEDLLLVPEGKEGAAMLPDQTATVPASAFSRCPRLKAVEVGEGNMAFYSEDGTLYSKETQTIVASPLDAESAPLENDAQPDNAEDLHNELAMEERTTNEPIRESESEDSMEDVTGSVPTSEIPKINEERPILPAEYLASLNTRATSINVTAPIVVTFGDGNGYDVANPPTSVTSTGYFENNSDSKVQLAKVECADNGADKVLEPRSGAPALASQKLFGLYPSGADSKAVDLGYGSEVNVATLGIGDFSIDAGSKLECVYRLNLGSAQVKASAADNGMSVQPLSTLTCTFEAIGQGEETDDFYLKDNDSQLVFSLAEVKAHAEDISARGAGSPYYDRYIGYVSDEKRYECKTKWDGVSYDVRIIGVNHDTKSDNSGTAGLTFQFVNCLEPHDLDDWGYNKGYRFNAGTSSFNTNAGGWGASELRARMNPGKDSVAYGTDDNAIWSMVPGELQDAVVEVEKRYAQSSDADTVVVSPDKLFVASYSELVASSYWSDSYPWTSQEGDQYEYWKGKVTNNAAGNPLLSKCNQSSSSAIIWWERSIAPYKGGSSFAFVAPNGNPGSYNGASNSNGVCPCFCL